MRLAVAAASAGLLAAAALTGRLWLLGSLALIAAAALRDARGGYPPQNLTIAALRSGGPAQKLAATRMAIATREATATIPSRRSRSSSPNIPHPKNEVKSGNANALSQPILISRPVMLWSPVRPGRQRCSLEICAIDAQTV